jgi:hypothetical protein
VAKPREHGAHDFERIGVVFNGKDSHNWPFQTVRQQVHASEWRGWRACPVKN